MKRCISGSNTTGSLQCCSCSTACIPARSASVRHQCSSSLQIHRTSRCDHVTSLLKELHWLPVPERIEFKLCALLYKCLSTRQQDGVPHWQFTASDGRQVTRTPAVVLIVNVSHPADTPCDIGVTSDRAFPVATARAWNALPDFVTAAPTVSSFCTVMNTYLFFRAFWHWQHTWYFWLCNVFLTTCTL